MKIYMNGNVGTVNLSDRNNGAGNIDANTEATRKTQAYAEKLLGNNQNKTLNAEVMTQLQNFFDSMVEEVGKAITPAADEKDKAEEQAPIAMPMQAKNPDKANMAIGILG